MAKFMRMKYVQVLFLSGLAMLLAGCGEKDMNATLNVADATGTVTGRVIDGSTLLPVRDAEVALIFNGTKMVTRTNSSSDPDLAGTFVFSGVPATGQSGSPYGSGHVLKITATGFATIQRSIFVSPSIDNTPVTTNLGTISLGKGFDLTVVTTDRGTPVAGVTVTAVSPNFFPSIVNITAVTDANGKAVLTGLNQEESYNIFSAPFYDSTGSIKYLTSSIGFFDPRNSDRTVSIPLISASRDDNIQIVASNLLSHGTTNGFFPPSPIQDTTTPDGVIKVVFNFPVELSGSVTASYVNNLVPSTDPDFGKTFNVPTVAATLDATRTILTITNSTPYIKNQTYTFNGTVTAQVNGQIQSLSLNQANGQFFPHNPLFSNSIYVADNTATGLNATTILKADNFNGTSGANATSVPAQVFVKFPEKVFGTYRVLSTRSGATTTAVNGAPVTFNFTDGEVLFASNPGFPGPGADNAVSFRLQIQAVPPEFPFPLFQLALADNDAVTIFFDVTDAEGNRFSREVTLPVQ